MKKVVFVCLLTLSVCLSQPADQQSSTKPPLLNADGTKSTEKDAATTQATKPSAESTTLATNGKNPDKATGQAPVPSPVPATDGIKESTLAPPLQTTTNATVKPDNSKTSTAAPSSTTTTTSKPIEPIVTTTTTSAPPVPHPTASTNETSASTPHPPTLQARGFDGASFVGGIILTLGLIAIGFMGLKYYRAQTERNYHTL